MSRRKFKVTEINARHIATTYSFAEAGANFVEDSIQLTLDREHHVTQRGIHVFDQPYVFLRHVDDEPLLLEEKKLLQQFLPGNKYSQPSLKSGAGK